MKNYIIVWRNMQSLALKKHCWDNIMKNKCHDYEYTQVWMWVLNKIWKLILMSAASKHIGVIWNWNILPAHRNRHLSTQIQKKIWKKNLENLHPCIQHKDPLIIDTGLRSFYWGGGGGEGRSANFQLTPAMYVPAALMLWTLRPMPPAVLEMRAQFFSVS